MEPHSINPISTISNGTGEPPKLNTHRGKSFQSFLEATSVPPSNKTPTLTPVSRFRQPEINFESRLGALTTPEALGTYHKLSNQSRPISDWEKYKDDQLLSNPGGDHYDWGSKTVVSNPEEQASFWGRLGKDLSDAFGNLKNFFENLFSGAKQLYRDQNNQIKETSQRGFFGSIIDFFEGLGSALSFGTWRPDGEDPPIGTWGRLKFFFSKIKKSVCGDLIQGVPGSVIRMGEDLVLAGWNLAEAVPDATIENFEQGRELTTATFDNGQVVLDYLTDILPSGEAWLRVHACHFGGQGGTNLPIIRNITLPERYEDDARWQHVRNTPLRKTIETIGSLAVDFVSIKSLGETKYSSDERHEGH
jgi:hypothetical protein